MGRLSLSCSGFPRECFGWRGMRRLLLPACLPAAFSCCKQLRGAEWPCLACLPGFPVVLLSSP